jgi:amino acid transporter
MGEQPPGSAGPRLARALGAVGFFALAFGSIVGVGWVVVMDDWLKRGGPAGAALGFVLGGLLLLPVALVYGRLTEKIPEAGAEISYAAGLFPPWVGFAAGWMMALAYLIVCPFEAVAVGQLAAHLFPDLQRVPLYTVGGHTVYLPGLLLGLALVGGVVLVNYRGVRYSAGLQSVLTFVLLGAFVVFSALGLVRGRTENLRPAFAVAGLSGALLSTLLVLHVAPYYLAGFETVGKCSEERSPSFRERQFSAVTLAALGVGVCFYAAIILVVALLTPWQGLIGQPLPTLAAFRRAFHSDLLVNGLLLVAILSLIKVLNGCFLAATRLLYALGRNGQVPPGLGQVHPRFLTPTRAILFAGVFSALLSLLGKSALVPISEVGTFAYAVGWLGACLAYCRGAAGPLSRSQRAVGYTGAAVCVGLLAMKLLPFVPGSFGLWEYLCLAGWVGLGWALWRRPLSAPQRAFPGRRR